MEPYFTEYTDHKPEDLHLKSVEFEIAYGEGNITRGIGEIHVRKNPQKLVALEVRAEVVGPGPHQHTLHVLPQTKETRFLVERHPNKDVAVYRLSSYTPPPSSDPDCEFQ